MGLLDYTLVAPRRTNTMRGETWCGAKAGMTTAYPAPYPSWYDEHWASHGHGHVNWTIAFSGTAAQPDTLIPHGFDPSPSVPAEDPFGWQPGQTGYNGTVHLPVDDTFARLGFDIQGGYVHERGATGTRVLGGAMTFGGESDPIGGRFLERIRAEVRERAFPLLAERTPIRFATLGGDAGYVGTAGMARAEHLRLHPSNA